MLRKSNAFDHFWNGKTSHLLSLIRLTIFWDLIPHIILISFLLSPRQPHRPSPRCLWCVRSAAYHVIRRRTSTASRPLQMCGEFPRNQRSFRKSALHVALQHFPSTLSFLRERVWEIPFFIARGDGRSCGAWETNILRRKASSLSCLPSSKLPKLKLRRCARKMWELKFYALIPSHFIPLPANESFFCSTSFSFNFATSALLHFYLFDDSVINENCATLAKSKWKVCVEVYVDPLRTFSLPAPPNNNAKVNKTRRRQQQQRAGENIKFEN